ncbi:hypothetical protein Bca52824_069998 [Brassica carinata]|uniref:Uncharacterized protein n=1 Tax=Brassica carinata TaxID=52824 RepID=A0A8X7U2N8_BRACI|nr:hypothetical protein Bca52824_069998 [Brassica carinata]
MAGTDPYQQMNYGFAIGTPVAAQNTNVAVVSDVFCCPYPLQLTVKKKCKGLSGAKLELTSLHDGWTVHRGEGSDPRELMFTVKRSSALQWRARLDVFFQSHHHLPGNFSVVGTYFDDSAKVYHSNAVIAEVKEKTTFGGFFKGKQDFVVRINAGVDYAFIVSLLVILNETNTIL